MKRPETIQLKKDLLLAEKDDELFVLDIGSGRIHQFNQTAKIIFQMVLEPRSSEDVITAYARCFSLGQAEAEEDVNSILGMMRQYDLLRPAGNARDD